MLQGDGPQEHLDFVQKLLADHGVPEIPEEDDNAELLGWTEAIAGPQAEIALRHPKSACSSPTPSAPRRPT
jgi:hypothetical protein